MSSAQVSIITFLCLFGGAVIGYFISAIIPAHHLSDDSKDAVKIGTGLIATLTALVLGLLVSSAKNSFNSMEDEIKQSSAKIIILDQTLRKFGPEADNCRQIMHDNIMNVMKMIWPTHAGQKPALAAFEDSQGIQDVRQKILELAPTNEAQDTIKRECVKLANEISLMRWMIVEQAKSSLPSQFLITLIFWLVIFFTCFGLVAPRNGTVIAVIFLSTLSVSGAIFLILEMNNPLDGTMKISSAPLHKAIHQLEKV